MEFNESDWKLFRTRLPIWQENYMEKLNHKYIALLTGSGSTADNIWELNRHMQEDKRSIGVVAGMSRNNMELNMLHLLHDGVITPADLDGFSEELRGKMAFILRRSDDQEPAGSL